MEHMENLPDLLRRVWHFRHLSPADLSRIVTAGQIKHFREEEMIFQEGSESAGMFVLLRGKVDLYKQSLDGQEQILAVIEPVIMFNEITVIDDGPNPYTAIAEKDCITWNVRHGPFYALVQRYPDPEIGLGLLRIMAARTRLLINRCEDLSYRPVLARMAKLLVEISAGGTLIIDRSQYPIKKLAAHVASVPEVVSRSLSTLQERGLLRCDRQEIEVLNIARLNDVAQVERALENSLP
jgi:CRP-like cAMP-binding protein